MNLEQILNELESLKDYTNDHGKGVLNALKVAVAKLVEEPVTADVVEPSLVVEAEEVHDIKAFEPSNAMKKKRAGHRKSK